jgi:hypothetical protein
VPTGGAIVPHQPPKVDLARHFAHLQGLFATQNEEVVEKDKEIAVLRAELAGVKADNDRMLKRFEYAKGFFKWMMVECERDG